jgi:CubicO group peptidase (beta-lactamase class C family)
MAQDLQVSDRPFADCIAENVFQPLEITYSTFVQSLPAALAPFMSQGYLLASGGAGSVLELLNFLLVVVQA